MMTHQNNRTERDLRWLAANYSAGKIVKAIPERLECLAAWHRMANEADKACRGQPHAYEAAAQAYDETIVRLHEAGVLPAEGQFTYSPCCGSDR